jgi:NTP pyrophosphatase (non-canonical NTP hydrolase)
MSLQLKQSLNYLIYGAMVEVMLDSYENTKLLNYFDSLLLQKHKNLIPSWKRESKKIFDFLEASGNTDVIEQYHSIVRTLEAVLATTNDKDKFTELLSIIEEWSHSNFRVIHEGNHYQGLSEKVIDWAKEKGIFENGTSLAQANKTLEEVNELIEAVEAQSRMAVLFTNSKGKVVDTKAEIKDAFGDILVTIIIGAEMQGLDLLECLSSAYEVIAKRKGKMIDGQFVKEN